MTVNIYGVDINKPITSLIIRDAIVLCFYEAHCTEVELSAKKKNVANKQYCKTIVKKSFEDTGGNFYKPSKKSILMALDNLVEYSQNFRNPSIIEKHYNQIMVLLGKLK